MLRRGSWEKRHLSEVPSFLPSFLPSFIPSFLRSFIHFISFHFISFHFISLHFISFHFIPFIHSFIQSINQLSSHRCVPSGLCFIYWIVEPFSCWFMPHFFVHSFIRSWIDSISHPFSQSYIDHFVDISTAVCTCVTVPRNLNIEFLVFSRAFLWPIDYF